MTTESTPPLTENEIAEIQEKIAHNRLMIGDLQVRSSSAREKYTLSRIGSPESRKYRAEVSDLMDSANELRIENIELEEQLTNAGVTKEQDQPEKEIEDTRIEEKESLLQLQFADPKNVQEVVAAQLDLMTVYHNEALKQANQSFRYARAASVIGLGFFIAAVIIVIIQDAPNGAAIPLIAGVVAEVIAGVYFYLYAQTRRQMTAYQSQIDRTQRYVLANSLCEGLNDEAKDVARQELVKTVSLGGSPPTD